ncbi:MAG: TrkH family potassium uptake protein [Candidatus Amulumruptor caecigallinarius]|nr:TrkH family potassium uptake protein [Candidatus Amulumruptor caecigallinarius]
MASYLTHRAYINFPMLLRVVGWLLMIESLFMVIPCIVAIASPREEWWPFVTCMLITGTSGGLMSLIKLKSRDMGKREAIMLTGFTWIVLSMFGMLPFMFYGTHLSVTDAFFETMSGFTTTGASVLQSLDNIPKSILLWRCIVQWIGGLGIILFTLAVVPMLNYAGGMQLFNAEVTGITHDKLRPQVSYTAKGLWAVYAVLTIVLILLLSFSDMDIFDSVCYGLSTMSTGGFSTDNGGIHNLNSMYVKCVMILFMLLGGINFSLLYNAAIGKFKGILKNTVLKVYLGFIAVGTIVFAADVIVNGLVSTPADVTIDPLFQAVSLLSSTGITEPDFREWGSVSVVMLIVMMLVGACAGSTAGGAKLDRFVVLFKFLKNEFYKMMHPNAITTVSINGKGTQPSIVMKTLAFLFMYIIIIVVGGVALSMMGLSLSDGFFCALQAISNTGLGTSATGVNGDYSMISNGAKWLLAFIMLVGRLEIFTILLVFTPSFWKK